MFIYKVVRTIALPLFAICFPTKVINKEKFPKNQKTVVICNHYSKYDGLILAAKFFKKKLNCVAKKEAFSNKLGGKFFRKIGLIPVDREKPGISTHRSIMKVFKENGQLLIFPEGTRNRKGDKNMAPFKVGAGRYALLGKANVTPVMYHHSPRFFNKNYIMVGDQIDLTPYFNNKTHDVAVEVTKLITDSMNKLRIELDAYVESKKRGRKCK